MNQKLTHDGNRWSNADEYKIEITEYDPGWPRLMEQHMTEQDKYTRGNNKYIEEIIVLAKT